MDYSRSFLKFLLTSFCILLFLSFIDLYFNINWKPFRSINILTDLYTVNLPQNEIIKPKDALGEESNINKAKQFYSFSLPNRLTEYYKDTNVIVFNNLMQKLNEVKKGKRKKLRIAYFGDSMIEDDFISQTFRQLLQDYFGGHGIGYLAISNNLSNSRYNVKINANSNWVEHNFKNNPNKSTLYVSGRNFNAHSKAIVNIEDNTALPNEPLQKYILVGNKDSSLQIAANEVLQKVNVKENFNAILVDRNIGNTLKLETENINCLFGVSMESEKGVIVDNFSFRGSSGFELNQIDASLLKSLENSQPYDLIIMQYGINVFVKPDDQNFNWYQNALNKTIKKYTHFFPDASICLIGCSDVAFRYGAEYKTAIGLPNLIEVQQKVAYENNIGFYNMYASMGGNGSMVNWVNSTPALAYKDYMHPTLKGSTVLAQGLYDAFMMEYFKQFKNQN